MSLGATVTKLAYLGRNVVVSLKTPDDYLQDTSYLGAIVGRYANRIAGGRFPLNGETVQVAAERGPQSPARWQRRLPQAHLGS